MSRDQAGLRAVLRDISQSRERSTLFWWMVDHHAELVEASKGRRLQWRSLCARFAELGLADATGKPATPEGARLTWRRARAAVAEAQRHAPVPKPARQGSVYPSRISPNWRPQEAPQTSAPPVPKTPPESAPSQSLVPTQPAGPAPLSPFADTRTKEEIEAHIQEQERKMDEMFAKHDRKYRFGG